MRSARWLSVLGLAALAAVGCAPAEGAPASSADDVTSVPASRVKEQLIGNCWIYATLGWVESMHLAQTNEELNLSESYLTYLHWFIRITTDDQHLMDKAGDFMTGDFFGWGAEIIRRYGLMDDAAFISTEASVDRSTRQEAALKMVDKALKPGGTLATSEARKDKRKVRELLDQAFALPPALKAKMTRAFGADLAKTRQNGAVLEKGFRDPATMIAAKTASGRAITLDQAIGELDPDRVVTPMRDRGERRGPDAWQYVPFGKTPAERAATTLRLKKALNKGYSVPIDWYPAWASMRDSDASFHEPINLAKKGGWHASLVNDYQIDVPGHGVLPVGEPVTDPKLLEKSLAPNATIQLLRFKNSWGREVGPLAARGYTDATWAYLTTDFDRTAIDYDEKPERGAAIDALVLPPDSWL